MIPVFQTRYAAETFGNCFEACVASILELPLTAVPDRARFVDEDAWADRVSVARGRGDDVGDLDLPAEYEQGEQALRAWLEERGLGWFDLWLEEAKVERGDWLDVAAQTLSASHWIAHTRQTKTATLHSTVWLGARCVHNPIRGVPASADLGELVNATLLVAGDPAKLARLDPLPDVAGALATVRDYFAVPETVSA